MPETGDRAVDRARVIAMLEQLGRSPSHERMQQVFAIRDIPMKRIGWIGFDMDYTLAIYRREELDRLVHGLALERLVTVHGYPAEILEIPFHPGFAIRGLCVDKTTGHLLKLNAHRQIKKAWHGLRPLEQSEIDLYWREVLRLDSRRFMRLDTLFDLPEAYIICALIDWFESRALPCDFRKICDDTRAAVDLSHQDNSIKAAVLADKERYLIPDPQLADTLRSLRNRGRRKLFLVTNSNFAYTEGLMSWLVGAEQDWTSFFDLVVAAACKPRFFRDSVPAQRLNRAGEIIEPVATRFEQKGLYEGGNVEMIEQFFGDTMLETLYMGDHIYGDIMVSKRARGWRTVMIVPELDEELDLNSQAPSRYADWDRLDRELDLLNDEIAFVTDARESLDDSLEQEGERAVVEPLRQQVHALHDELLDQSQRLKEARRRLIQRIHVLQSKVDQKFHPHWGSVFVEGNDRTLFGDLIEEHADLYTSRVSNFLEYSTEHYFRAARVAPPHTNDAKPNRPNPQD